VTARRAAAERAARGTVLLRHMADLPVVPVGDPDAMKARTRRVDLLIDLLNDVDNPPTIRRDRGATVVRMMGLEASSKGGLEAALRNWCGKARRSAGVVA